MSSLLFAETFFSYRWLFATATFFLIALSPVIKWALFYHVPPQGLKPIPGPLSTLPYIGRVHDLDPAYPERAMRKFSNQFKGFFRLNMAGFTHIWIGDRKIAQELLVKRARVYSSRPEVPAVPGSDAQGQYLPLLAMNDHWRRQRTFAHTVLGESHNRKYSGYINHEAKRFLRNLLVRPNDHYDLTNEFCGRISARLGYGHTDFSPELAANAIEFISHISPSGPITNLLPFLAYVPEWLNPSLRRVRVRREKEAQLWKNLFHRARQDQAAGTLPLSYARSYFERQGERSFGFDDAEAVYAIGMLVTTGIFTIGGPLYCFMLAMVLFPKWQNKVRAEYDAVVGNRIVDLADRPRLPVLRAVLKECMRWRPPVALGVPRLVEEDDEWNGYFVPKGSIVHAIELSMARDEEHYPDPEAFRPERWLESGWPTYCEPLTEFPRLMGYHGFGMGKRICVGMDITEAELLVACGSLAGCFEFKPRKDNVGKDILPDDTRFTPNLIGGPLPFDMDLRPRSEKYKKMVENWYEESLADEKKLMGKS